MSDEVDLSHLPRKSVLKARQVLADLKAGESLHRLRGKRLSFDRTLMRFPVGYRYRLVCRQGANGVLPLGVMSHEDFNAVGGSRRRMG